MKRIQQSSKGYLLLEILIATVIFGVLIASVVPTLGFLMKRVVRTNDDIAAQLILQEGIETAYNVITTHWNAYPDGLYVASVDTTGPSPIWTLVEGSEDKLQAKYSRTISIEHVLRNETTGKIGAGIVDSNSRIIVSDVSWKTGGKMQKVSARLLVVNYER